MTDPFFTSFSISEILICDASLNMALVVEPLEFDEFDKASGLVKFSSNFKRSRNCYLPLKKKESFQMV